MLQDTAHCASQFTSIFQESDSGRFSLAKQETLLSHCNQSGVFSN